MGDRGNIVVRGQNGSEVFLYAHWTGGALPITAQEVLRKNLRWSDAGYLARLMFCAMVRESDDIGGELGYGISTQRLDYNHHDVVIDVEKQKVFFRDPVKGTSKSLGGFRQFCSLTQEQFDKLRY